MKILFATMMSIVLMTSCSSASAPTPDRQLNGLTGNVKSLHSDYYRLEAGMNTSIEDQAPTYMAEEEYNAQGYLIRDENFPCGCHSERTDIQYYANGKRKKATIVTEISSGTITYKYEENQLNEEVENNDKGDHIRTTTLTYNEKGLVDTRKTISNGGTYTILIYKYNDKGVLTSVRSENEMGDHNWTTHYEYLETDAQGNWTKANERTEYGGGTSVQTTLVVRKITYF